MLITKRFFNRVEISTLHVFDNRDFQRGPVINVADNDWNLGQPGNLRRPPPPLSRNDFVGFKSAVLLAHDDWLDNAMGTDRLGQVHQFGLGEGAPRIARIARNQLNWNTPVGAGCWRGSRSVHFANQGCQPPAETLARWIVIHVKHPLGIRFSLAVCHAARNCLSRWMTSDASCKYAWLPEHLRSYKIAGLPCDGASDTRTLRGMTVR